MTQHADEPPKKPHLLSKERGPLQIVVDVLS